jgi:hypothetical protein
VYTSRSNAHCSSRSGRKDTLAVICRMIAWISDMISFFGLVAVTLPANRGVNARYTTKKTEKQHAYVRLITAVLGVDLERPPLQHLLGLNARHDQHQLLHLAVDQPICATRHTAVSYNVERPSRQGRYLLDSCCRKLSKKSFSFSSAVTSMLSPYF